MKRTSAEEKKKAGTYRSDRDKAAPEQPALLENVPDPPESLPPEGRYLWEKLAPLLLENGLLSEMDLSTLEMTCATYGTWKELHDFIHFPLDPKTGERNYRPMSEFLGGRNAQTVAELTVMNRNMDKYIKLISEFGLSPQSRTKLDILTLQADTSKTDAEKARDELFE